MFGAIAVYALLFVCEVSGATDDGVYSFETQPPENLQCNPYVSEYLRIECSIHAPIIDNEQHLPKVVWQKTKEGGDSTLLEEDAEGTVINTVRAVDPNIPCVLWRSTLTIALYNQTQDAASFKCHLAIFLDVQGGIAVFQLSEPSIEMSLYTPSDYKDNISCFEDTIYFQLAPQNVSFCNSSQNVVFPLTSTVPSTPTETSTDTSLMCSADNLGCIFRSRKMIIITATVGGALLIAIVAVSIGFLVICRKKQTVGPKQKTASLTANLTEELATAETEDPSKSSHCNPPIIPKKPAAIAPLSAVITNSNSDREGSTATEKIQHDKNTAMLISKLQVTCKVHDMNPSSVQSNREPKVKKPGSKTPLRLPMKCGESEQPVIASSGPKKNKVAPTIPKRIRRVEISNGVANQQQSDGILREEELSHNKSSKMEITASVVYTEPGTATTSRKIEKHLPLAAADSDCQYVLPNDASNRHKYQVLLPNQMNERASYTIPGGETNTNTPHPTPAYITPIA